ncbi:MAG: TonB-dependent receptor [Proteobacteria bacterium]|nr:TonB-dependent receptor [Pseudomonadota bacterium]
MSASSIGRHAPFLVSAGLIALAPGIAMAQVPEDAAVRDQVTFTEPGEIVVTAQKRSERAIDVPVSLSVLGRQALDSSHMTQADDLSASIPNLRFSATVGENTPIFSLRGVSMADFSLNQAGPVATYYDEVYKGNFAFLGVQLYDLDRIEVLRGPQGTLYGKNTTGGAINLVAARPVFENTGNLRVGVGNYDRVEAQGAVNLVLGPQLAARVAFTAARADGWFRNKLPGKPDLNATREYGVRGSLLWEPSATTQFILRLSTSLQNPTNYGSYSNPGPNGTGAGAYGDGNGYFRDHLGQRELEAEYTPRRHARTWAAALTGQVALSDTLTLTSVTGWDKGELYVPEDTDGSPLRTLEIPYTDRGTQMSQELRLTSSSSGPLTFILGAYYHRETLFNATTMNFWADLDVDGNGRVDARDCASNASFLACVINNRFDQTKHSYALFGDARYRVGAATTVRLGLRQTWDDGRQAGLASTIRGVDGVLVATPIPAMDRRFATSNLSGKIGIDHRLGERTLLFASVGRGYRASGFNAQAFFDPSEANVAKPETLDAYEAGIKAETADRVLSVSATGFYYDYRNQQFLSVNPANAAQNLVNLPRSRIYGGELELDLRPLRTLALHAGLGLLHARAREGVISGTDVRGNRLANAPARTLNVSGEWVAVDSDVARLVLRADVSAVSSQYFEILNIPRLRSAGYALVGASAELSRGPWTVSVWGKNLGDTFYFTSRIDLSGFGFDYAHVGTPRMFGASLRYDFR